MRVINRSLVKRFAFPCKILLILRGAKISFLILKMFYLLWNIFHCYRYRNFNTSIILILYIDSYIIHHLAIRANDKFYSRSRGSINRSSANLRYVRFYTCSSFRDTKWYENFRIDLSSSTDLLSEGFHCVQRDCQRANVFTFAISQSFPILIKSIEEQTRFFSNYENSETRHGKKWRWKREKGQASNDLEGKERSRSRYLFENRRRLLNKKEGRKGAGRENKGKKKEGKGRERERQSIFKGRQRAADER